MMMMIEEFKQIVSFQLASWLEDFHDNYQSFNDFNDVDDWKIAKQDDFK